MLFPCDDALYKLGSHHASYFFALYKAKFGKEIISIVVQTAVRSKEVVLFVDLLPLCGWILCL